jgi:putative oxidoreductase
MTSAPQYSTSATPLIGRSLIAVIFLISGAVKLAAPAETQGSIVVTGIPAPTLAYVCALLIELCGGTLLLVGYRVRPIALVLAAYCVITAFIFHHALNDQNQLFHFLKNLAISGGLLVLFEFGAGAYSLDSLRASAAEGY